MEPQEEKKKSVLTTSTPVFLRSLPQHTRRLSYLRRLEQMTEINIESEAALQVFSNHLVQTSIKVSITPQCNGSNELHAM